MKYLSKDDILNMRARDLSRYDTIQIERVIKEITDIDDLSISEIFYVDSFSGQSIRFIYKILDNTGYTYNGIANNLREMVKHIIDNKARIDKARYDASKRTIQDIMYGLVNDLRNSVFEINSIEDYMSFKEALYEMDKIVLSHYRKEESNDQ
jgi:hypothetical protein